MHGPGHDTISFFAHIYPLEHNLGIKITHRIIRTAATADARRLLYHLKRLAGSFAGLGLLLVCIPGSPIAGAVEYSPILDVFPRSIVELAPDRQGQTVFSSRYTPSGSSWDKRLDEQDVFQMSIVHQQDPGNSFSLRMGRGGQMYSLRGAFGEGVPPSWREGNDTSPWNDEVWQFVAVCTKYNGLNASLKAGNLPDAVMANFRNSPYKDTFFVHNSGAYIAGASSISSLYCPLLGSEVLQEDRCYRMVNWGLVPQVKTVHRSPLLYYTQVRDVGDGIIELTWVVHNFSVRDDVVFDHLNAPWGGTRVSSLPLRYVSSPEGVLRRREEILNPGGVVEVRKTGGWNLSCASDADHSPSLALVFGRDKHLEAELGRMAAGENHCQFKPSLYRDWRAGAPVYQGAWKDWATRPANSFRNYDVAEVIPKLRLAPGTTIWYRSFLIINRRDEAVELAKSLVDKVDYGLVEFDPTTTAHLPVWIRDGHVESGDRQRSGKATFELAARPVIGTMPLFLIQNTETGRQVITTDPYAFVKKEKQEFEVPPEHPHHDYYEGIYGYSMDENHSNWQLLLGFGYQSKPNVGDWKRLSELLEPSLFPEANRYHIDLWVRI